MMHLLIISTSTAKVIAIALALTQLCSCKHSQPSRYSMEGTFYCPDAEELITIDAPLPDSTLIRATVFAHHLCYFAKRPADLTVYGAVVLIVPKTENNHFRKPQVTSNPVIDLGDNRVVRTRKGNVLHKNLGTAALLIEVNYIAINGDEATAQVNTFSGPYDVSIWEYHLKRTADIWIVTQARKRLRA